MWNYLRDHYGAFVDRFTLNNRYLGNMLKFVLSRFTTPRQREEVDAFLRAHPDAGSGRRARQQGLEELDGNVEWIRTHAGTLQKWLGANGYA